MAKPIFDFLFSYFLIFLFFLFFYFSFAID